MCCDPGFEERAVNIPAQKMAAFAISTWPESRRLRRGGAARRMISITAYRDHAHALARGTCQCLHAEL